MEPFKSLTSVAAPLDRINVDTDAIIPKQFLKRIERTGFGPFCFYEWRFETDGVTPRADFTLNQPRYQGANILVAGDNFGCGSSREHAPWALLDMGFKVVIAPSFADIFFNNCFQNGLLPIRLPQAVVSDLWARIASHEGYQLTVDLANQQITGTDGFAVSFDVDSYRKDCLLRGLDDIGISLQYADKIAAFESARPAWQNRGLA